MHTRTRLAAALTLASAGFLGGCGSTLKVDREHDHKPATTHTLSAPTAYRPGPQGIRGGLALRGDYHYVYYPATQVYYAPDRDQYAWLAGQEWRVGMNPPDRLLIKLVDPVQIELDDREPWAHQHHTVAARYPQPGTETAEQAKLPKTQDQTAFVSD